MTKTVDARGLSCPQPVMLVQDAIKEGEFPIEVLVDTVTSRENVFRMVKSKSLQVDFVAEGDEFKLTIVK
ncbi:MAG: sulfurtransferase TusA family protein [Chloroflexi bacterium]|nr:sulfurtransferase TusA family protein [Chloroflexota bacterium]